MHFESEFGYLADLPFAVAVLDSDGHIVYNNSPFTEHVLNTDTAIGFTDMSVLLEVGDYHRLKANIKNSGGDQSESRGLKSIRLKGQSRWFDIRFRQSKKQQSYTELYWLDISTEHKTKALVDAYSQNLSLLFDESFHTKICHFLCQKLEHEFAFIGKLVLDSKVEVLACIGDGKVFDPFTYELEGAPCENVIGRECCVYPTGVQQLFPNDIMLQEIDVDSYIGSPLFDKHGVPIGIIAVMGRSPITDAEFTRQVIEMFSDRISAELDRKLAHEKLQYQANYDDLCDIPNRHFFLQVLEESLSDARANATQHSLLYIDLDQFKVVNDSCGHASGDELLKQIALILRKEVPEPHCLARLGGDEFAVLIKNAPESEGVEYAKRILSALNKHRFACCEMTVRTAASIGITEVNRTSESVTELLKYADSACYSAKENGRNQYHCYRNDQSSNIHLNGIQMMSELNSSLENNRFVLFAQAIQPADSDLFDPPKHYEVLLRKLGPCNELLSPYQSLTIAEKYDRADLVDEWVISNCFQLLQRYPLFLDAIDLISINLSGQSLGAKNLRVFIKKQLQVLGLPAHKFCFEVTETSAISKLPDAVKFITDLKSIGCKFALDDFGTGLSSLSYLKHLPVDILKIDGSFVQEMCSNNVDHSMVKFINEMGHILNMRTVAEFVESDEIIHLLKSLNIDYIQGYRVSKPQPLIDIIQRVNAQSSADIALLS